MSIRSARDFIDRVRTDAEFKENVVSLLGTGEEIRNYIRSEGFEFDYGELQAASASVPIRPSFVVGHFGFIVFF